MPADGIPLPFAIRGDVGTSRPEEQLLIETKRSNTHPKDLILACAEQAIRPKSATAMSVLGQFRTHALQKKRRKRVRGNPVASPVIGLEATRQERVLRSVLQFC